jgi:vesicle coat complex subunit
MRVLGQLELAMLMALGSAVASSLSDADPDVRMAGLRVLARLDASQLAKHANAIVDRLADPDSDVRGSPRMAP